MNLWLSFHFLFAALVLSSSALTPEECKPLVTPLSMEDPSVVRLLWLLPRSVGWPVEFTGERGAEVRLVQTDLQSAGGSRQQTVTEGRRVSEVGVSLFFLSDVLRNGTCMISTTNVTFEGNTATVEMANSTSSFYLLPSCDGCLVFMINSTARNTKHLLKLLKIDLDASDEIAAHSLYLLGKGSTLKEPELEHFKQQATCMGFSGEPHYIYNPEKSFCAEGEGIKVPL
ncbi:uncharacterized protein LOC118455659 [Neolamprologus brichardi]|uniref:uncharacterized protein LOC118455659 n=1 Tax=Neolamprologus brichardi TaxID=32507 RepID=UPI001643739B|nr:uncharacterized protein LOC118455659 [Neolamprologus brichardi]